MNLFNYFNAPHIRIKNQEKLKSYIIFCEANSQPNKIPHLNSLHHILPKSLFSEYSNLKRFKWNGCYLSHSNHLRAHIILYEAISNKEMEDKVKEIYLRFDHKRKIYESEQADSQDIQELEAMRD